MTSTWSEDYTEDYGDAYDDAESYLDGDSDSDSENYDEASRAELQRRATRQRQVAAARRNQQLRSRALARPVPGPTRPPTPQQAVAAIRNIDLDNKVQDDNIRRAMGTLNKRLTRSEYAGVGTALVSQFIQSFNMPQNPIAQALLRVAPLAASIKAPTRGVSVTGYLGRNPAIPGVVAAVAVAFAGDRLKSGSKAQAITILVPSTLTASSSVATPLHAEVTDAKGRVLDMSVTWRVTGTGASLIDGNRLIVDTAGTVLVTAEVEDRRKTVLVTVLSATGTK